MNLEDICKEFVTSHDDGDTLSFCLKEISIRYNAAVTNSAKKNYELVSMAIAEMGLYLNILKALDAKVNKDKKKDSVVVA